MISFSTNDVIRNIEKLIKHQKTDFVFECFEFLLIYSKTLPKPQKNSAKTSNKALSHDFEELERMQLDEGSVFFI